VCPLHGSAVTEPTRLISSAFFVRLDERTGAIKNLFSRSLGRDLVNPKAPTALNDYFYLPGSDLKGLQRNGPPRITVKENGPLVASLLVDSDAPGCRQLLREIRVIDRVERIEIIDTVDKLAVRTKEGIHFGWGFQVPGGIMRMDEGWAEITPEVDQIPAACKNWFSVQRWVDISNDKFGVTWSPIDAPLVEVGGITANLLGSQTDYRAWIDHLQPSQTLYSWAMNNHWHTNYRADQEGPTVFRYAISPHHAFSPDEAARFGIACSQPLLAMKTTASQISKSRLTLSTDRVLVSALKPSDDGQGLIVRLFGASGKDEKIRLLWGRPEPRRVWLSDTSELPHEECGNLVDVPGWGIVTLRAE
jgi:alpha-mannosidase